MIVLFAGLVMGAIVVDRYNTYMQLAVGYALISVLLCLIGIQTVFTGIILHTIRAFLTDHHVPRRNRTLPCPRSPCVIFTCATIPQRPPIPARSAAW